MPIFEYVCRDCGKEFELLIQGMTAPVCPSCHSGSLEKKFSGFAVKSAVSSERQPPGACAACDSWQEGGCARNPGVE